MSAMNDVEPASSTQTAGLLTALRRHPVVVVVCIVVAAAIGAGITYLLPTHFSAQARVVLGSENDSTVFRTVPNLNATAKAQNAAQIMRSDTVLARASTILHGKLSANKIKNAVTVAPGDEGSPLVTATAVRNSAGSARDVANAVGQAYLDVTRSQSAARAARAQKTLETAQKQTQASIDSTNKALTARAAQISAGTPKGLTVDARARYVQSTIDSDSRYQALKDDADGLATNLDTIKQKLQQTAIDAELAQSGVDTLYQAGTPANPGRSDLERNVGIAAVIGLLIGAAFAWRRLDRERGVVDHTQVATVLGAPLLARFGRTRELASLGTVVDLSPGRRLADDLRVVASSLVLHLRHHDLAAAVITSARPREGKTTFAVNLAAAAHSSGHDVVLVDGDVRRATVSAAFGLTNRPGLRDLIAGAPGEHVRHDVPYGGGSAALPVVPVGSDATASPTGGLPALSDADSTRAVVDSPALTEDPTTLWLASGRGGLVIVVSSASRLDDLRALRSRATLAETPIIGFIVNDRRKHWYDRLRPSRRERGSHQLVGVAASTKPATA